MSAAPPLLTRESILNTTPPIERVPCPEWDGDVFVKKLTAVEFHAWASVRPDGETDHGRLMRLLTYAVCDDAGRPLFSPADADALAHRDCRVVDRLVDVAFRLKGLGAKAAEETVNN